MECVHYKQLTSKTSLFEQIKTIFNIKIHVKQTRVYLQLGISKNSFKIKKWYILIHYPVLNM